MYIYTIITHTHYLWDDVSQITWNGYMITFGMGRKQPVRCHCLTDPLRRDQLKTHDNMTVMTWSGLWWSMKSAWRLRQGLDIGSRVFKIGIIRAAFNHGYHVLSTLFLSKDLAQQDTLLLPCYDLWQSLGYLGAKFHGLIGYTFVEMIFLFLSTAFFVASSSHFPCWFCMAFPCRSPSPGPCCARTFCDGSIPWLVSASDSSMSNQPHSWPLSCKKTSFHVSGHGLKGWYLL